MDFNLEEFIASCSSLGNGLILKKGGNYLFAIGNQKYWKTYENKLIVSFSSIGGNIEHNENIIDSVYREVEEESGTLPELRNSKKTYFFDVKVTNSPYYSFEIQKESEISKNFISNVPFRPLMIYKDTFPNKKSIGVFIFEGSLKKDPKPSMEVPGLLTIHRKIIDALPLPLSEIINKGVILETQPGIKIQKNAIIAPFGSAFLLQHLLKANKLD